MQPKSSVFLRVLLNAFHPGSPQAYLKVLPQDQAKEVMDIDVASQNAALGLTWFQQVLTRTHYSWLAPAVEKVPKGLRTPLIAAMPEPQSSGLQRMLKLAPFPGTLPSSAKLWLLEQFSTQWQEPEAIPLDYIRSSPLSILLTLSKNELVEVIDFLAMHDLAEGIRQVVDKKKLKMIYLCLTAKKQQFLRTCLFKREKLAAPKFDVERWNGKPETLNDVLHRRGLLRFGKALNGLGRNFLWHIVHTLDIGRGRMIAQYYEDNATPEITTLLIQQVVSVVNFLKPKSSS